MKKKPKILIIGWFPFPYGDASSSRIRTLGQGLVENGWRVHVVSTCSTPWREEDIGSDGKMWWNGISYETVNSYSCIKIPPPLSHRIRNHAKAQLRLPAQIRALLEEESFDALYLYLRAASSIYPLLRVAAKLKVPVFTDQVEWFTPKAFAWGKFDLRFYDETLGRRLLLSRVRAATAISTFIERKFISSGKPCLLLPSVYDFEKAIALKPTLTRQNGSECFKVIYAGTCKVGDGFNSLLKAIKLARQQGCPLILSIVGTDGRRGRALKMRKIIEADQALRGNVDFLGRLSEEEYPVTLASVDCLVLPRPKTQIVEAAFPTRLPEFLGTGLPVVTTIVPDVPKYLDAGVDAELAEPTPGGLAEAFIRIWNDAERALKIGSRGKAKAIRYFDYRPNCSALSKFLMQHM